MNRFQWRVLVGSFLSFQSVILLGNLKLAKICLKVLQNSVFEFFYNFFSKILSQANRTVLHYVARCGNEEARREIFDESIMSGADKFAKDSVISKLFLSCFFFFLYCFYMKPNFRRYILSGADKFAKDSVIFKLFLSSF